LTKLTINSYVTSKILIFYAVVKPVNTRKPVRRISGM